MVRAVPANDLNKLGENGTLYVVFPVYLALNFIDRRIDFIFNKE